MNLEHPEQADSNKERSQDNAPTSARRGYRIGQVLADKYRIERVIGEGAMGIVLAATHLGLDELVAIKFIRADLQSVPGSRSRFAREAKIASRIRSEHVVKVLDVGSCESIGPYIVMEYLEGQGLGSIGDARGRIAVPKAVEYVMQACEALAAAHRIGVTHRDIKPENLFLTLQGSLEVIKLLDFGISKASLTGRVFGDDLALTKTSYVIGTPMYMSPEQIRAARQVDHRTDIWSIGAVLYELVTGQTAFTANSVPEICANILESPTPRIADICPNAPPELQVLLERCLQKNPDDRFQNVAELALALSPFGPNTARSYAERSSSILRGSSLNLGSGANTSSIPSGGSPAAPAQQLAAWPSHFRKMNVWKLGCASAVLALGFMLWPAPQARIELEPSPLAAAPIAQTASFALAPRETFAYPTAESLSSLQLVTPSPLAVPFGQTEEKPHSNTPVLAEPPSTPKTRAPRPRTKPPQKRKLTLINELPATRKRRARQIRLVAKTPETP